MKNLLTYFGELRWRVNGRLFGFGTSPEMDWKIIFIATAALALLMTAWNVFVFTTIDKGEIFATEKSTEPGKKMLDISLLRETVSYYQNKALELERLKGSVTPAADPSL